MTTMRSEVRPDESGAVRAESHALEVRVSGPHHEGYVVIDTVVEGRSAGGVRIADDLPVDEVRALAEEMTLKYSLFHLPRGGAKAGVRMDSRLPLAVRLAALEDFGRALRPLIDHGIYNPGMDMNCGPAELRAIYAGAGIELGAVTDTSWFTAISVFHALEVCAARVVGDRGPVRIAVEGFGSVARHLADRLDPQRYRVVAVATVEGAVLSPDGSGFDPHDLSRRKQERGDAFVHDLPGRSVGRDEVLAADCDVLLPSSRTWVLGPELARRLPARAVVPIANAPYVGDAVDVLHRAGVICLPGYLSNVGGVLASSLYDQGLARTTVERLFTECYRPVVAGIVEAAAREQAPATEVAAAIARGHLPARLQPRERSLTERVYERFLRRRLPRAVRAEQARRTFLTHTASLRAEIERRTERA